MYICVHTINEYKWNLQEKDLQHWGSAGIFLFLKKVCVCVSSLDDRNATNANTAATLGFKSSSHSRDCEAMRLHCRNVLWDNPQLSPPFPSRHPCNRSHAPIDDRLRENTNLEEKETNCSNTSNKLVTSSYQLAASFSTWEETQALTVTDTTFQWLHEEADISVELQRAQKCLETQSYQWLHHLPQLANFPWM